MTKKVVVFIILFLLPMVLGETYHVRIDGDNSLDGLSYENAWETITYAIDNAESNSEVFVYPGEYLENEGYGGYITVREGYENRSFISIGETTVKADPGNYRMVLFLDDSNIEFNGFTFDGENSINLGIDSSYGNKMFRDNKFINFLDIGISLKGGENNLVANNTFGYEDQHMAFSSVIFKDLNKSRIKNNRFYSGNVSVVYIFNSSNISIEKNAFGSENNPMFLDTYGKFVKALDSDDFVFEDNQLYVGDGNGISVYTSTKDIENAKILNNTFNIYHALNRYGIAVGAESEQEHDVLNFEISGNKLYMPIEETYKHNLFIGFTKNSIVKDNYLNGGGYGLALKGNNDALIYDNEVYNASVVAIVDNAGWNNKIFNNVVNCKYDRCMRIDNTESAARPLYNSTWFNNIMFGNSEQLFIYIGSRVNVTESGSVFFNNTYHLDEHDQVICSHNVSYLNFDELEENFGWGENSNLFAHGEFPEIESISVYGIQPTSARVKFNTSESSDYTIRYGIGGLSEEVGFSEYRLYHDHFLGGLTPKTLYYYQITVCDNEENCVDSDIMSFRTKKGSGIKLHFISMWHGDDFWN